MIKDLRLKIFIFGLWVMGLFLITHHSSLITVAYAQTIDPNIWQQSATGLKLQSINIKKYDNTTITQKKTAGLLFTVLDNSWPGLSLQGGLQFAGWGKNSGPVGVDLGLIKNGGSSSSLSSESADWVHNELTFNSGGPNQIKVWASRLSPAILLQNSTNSLRLFSGSVNSYINYDQTGQQIKFAPSYPKYIAYSSGGTVQVQPLSSTAISLPPLDNKWILVWYGTNSHFYDTKRPIPEPYPIILGCCDGKAVSLADSYQADSPMFLSFENNPTNIAHSPEGGIDLSFSASSGNTTLLPLFGREHLKASDTEGWATPGNFPNTVVQKINFWTQRFCQYPVTASESYKYDSPSDTSTITEDITFIPVCSHSSKKFSIIPPMLAIAKDAFGTNLKFTDTSTPPVAVTPTNGNLPTEFGPILGFDNLTSYSWNLSGLKKYTDYQRPVGNLNNIPQGILDELKTQVGKIVADGHYSPWMMADRMTHSSDVGDIYFSNPADNIYLLSEVIPVLPEPQKTNLTNYLKSERSNPSYQPESVFKLPMGNGKIRGPFNVPDQIVAGAPSQLYQRWDVIRPEVFMKRVWLYNFYALARYYDITNEVIADSVLTAAKNTLDNDSKEQDWASFYWFRGFEDRRIAVMNANRHLAGLVGLIRIANKKGDSTTENLARALLAKAAVLKVGMAKTPGYYYNSGLAELPTNNPAWQAKLLAGEWSGKIINYDWDDPLEDARVATNLDQFGLTLFDSSGWMSPLTGWNEYNRLASASLTSFRDLTPEVALLLSDYAKVESETYIKKVEALMPHWYSSFTAEAFLGAEHNISHPTDAFQIFMAKAWIQGETAQNLEKYIDIPYLTSGDLFYVQKLAETARVYAASASPLPSVSPSPSPIPGDIVPNGIVDIFDYNQLLSDFGKSGTGLISDIVPNNRVDIFDYNLLLSNFGKSVP